MRTRKWTDQQLIEAAKKSRSIAQVLGYLNLVPAGGNYAQIKKFLKQLGIDTAHFSGHRWSKGLKLQRQPTIPLQEVLREGTNYQSFKLKRRLFAAKLKPMCCEECGWAKQTPDGYLPLELDHINGNRHDNRLENLRVLCPNCHSLKPTHRGRKLKK